MDTFRYLVRFLYRIRWYLTILPLIALIIAWFLTRNMERVYDTNTTIYTGMITGYNIEGGTGVAGGNPQTNINNLMLIITTDNTIHGPAPVCTLHDVRQSRQGQQLHIGRTLPRTQQIGAGGCQGPDKP